MASTTLSTAPRSGTSQSRSFLAVALRSLASVSPHRRITNGIYSDYFTTAVRTSGKAGETNGISFLLIPKTEGVTCKRMLMSGQWCAGTTFVTFEDVKVPVENLIGKEGAGFKMIMTNVSFGPVSPACRLLSGY